MATREQLVIDLPADVVAGLRDAVRSGTFASESEGVEVILRVWLGDEGVEEPDTETLRALVAEGIADADAGRFVKTDEMFDRLRARIRGTRVDRAGD